MKKISLLALIIFLHGCSITMTMPYQPQNTEEFDAQICVEEFNHLPQPGDSANQIHNTAAGKIYLTENIDKFWTNSIRKEFRQSGISLKTEACFLTGTIHEFTLDDLGFSVDYISKVHYILLNANRDQVVSKDVVIKFKSSKFVVAGIVFANINKAISDNITQLLTSESFIKAVSQHCTTPSQTTIVEDKKIQLN